MADKLTIRTNLVRKEERFEPKNCVVEKVIPLYEGSFQELMKDPFNDYSYIKGYTDLMREDEDGVHCILFISKESGDGILVEADDSGRAKYVQFVPRAEDILLAQSFTETEKKYHDFYSKYINDAINSGSESCATS